MIRVGADLASLDPVETWSAPDESYGASVTTGDADGDGLTDLWVGAPSAELGRGAAHLHKGSGATVRVGGLTPGDRLGDAIARCGDLTGDGVDDWLLSAPGFSPPPEGPLAALPIPKLAGVVFFLPSEGLIDAEGEAAPWDLGGRGWWGASVGAGAGEAISCRDDLDGDGVPDVAIGAPFTGDDDAGELYVLSGAALPASGPLADVAKWRLPGTDASDWQGAAVATADFDADGRAELVVGAPGWDAGRGRALLWDGAVLQAVTEPGQARGVLSPPRRTSGSTGPPQHFGRVLGIADLDDDARPDLLFGVPDATPGAAFDAGLIAVWMGARAPWSAAEVLGLDEDQQLAGDRSFQRVGEAFLGIDADGDGLSELVITTRVRPRL